MSQSQSLQLQQSDNVNTTSIKFFKNCQWYCKSQASNKKKSPNYPCKRWGHTAVIHDKYMYIFGGCGKSENAKQWEHLYRMDCNNYSWERVQTNSTHKPQSRDSHTCVKLQNKLYFYGGSCNDKIFSDLWEFDLELLEWKQIEIDPQLEAREGHSAVSITDRLMYIYGGWDSEKNLMQNNHWLFDSETLLFVQIQNVNGDEIPKRESHSSTLVGDKIYTFGGQGQNVGKNHQFFKDLFQISFEPFAQLHQKFDQFYENRKVNSQCAEPVINIESEKIKANSGQTPSARASHSAVSYVDKFFFIIGGEGYKNDQLKDNEGLEMEQQQNEQDQNSNEDDEMKPFYPKNDVWLYECQLRYWCKVIAINKTPVFQPRFSQSCVVFQDSIIVFGGLRLMGDVLEDIFVLHLKDSDNYLQKCQKEDMKNICKYCQMIYAVQSEDDIINKGQIHNYGEMGQLKSLQMSMQFLNSLVQLIQWPFTCIGLLTDNAILSKAKEFKVSLEMKKINRYQWNSNGNGNNDNKSAPKIIIEEEDDQVLDVQDEISNKSQEKIPSVEFAQYMGVLRFEEVDIIGLNENEYLNIIYNWNREMTNEVDPDCRRQYASNLKIGGLRLGQSVLFVSKSKNVYRISLISSNKQINGQMEEMIVYYYSVKVQVNKEQSISNQTQKSLIRNCICYFLDEKDYIMDCDYDYNLINIFDLQKQPNSQTLYELQSNNGDIINNNYKGLVNAQTMLKYPDFSLVNYYKYYNLDPIALKVSINNTHTISLNGYRQQIKQNADVKRIENSELPKGSCRLELLLCNDYIDEGVLIYYNGRLINRFERGFQEYKLKRKQYMVSGYMEIEEQPNLFLNDILNSYCKSIMYSQLKQIVKCYAQPKRKAQSSLEQEPEPRKINQLS